MPRLQPSRQRVPGDWTGMVCVSADCVCVCGHKGLQHVMPLFFLCLSLFRCFAFRFCFSVTHSPSRPPQKTHLPHLPIPPSTSLPSSSLFCLSSLSLSLSFNIPILLEPFILPSTTLHHSNHSFQPSPQALSPFLFQLNALFDQPEDCFTLPTLSLKKEHYALQHHIVPSTIPSLFFFATVTPIHCTAQTIGNKKREKKSCP